jgi:hypothetical protein
MNGTLAMYARALEGWPARLADEASPIIARHARAAFAGVKAAYAPHRKTGTLEAGLTLTDESTPLHPAWTLENDVYYALIFEVGGATTEGPKAAGRAFLPVVIETRRAIRREILPLLQQEIHE